MENPQRSPMVFFQRECIDVTSLIDIESIDCFLPSRCAVIDAPPMQRFAGRCSEYNDRNFMSTIRTRCTYLLVMQINVLFG